MAQSHYTGKPHQKKLAKRIAEGSYHVGKQALITGHKRPADGKVPVPTEGFPDSIKKPKMVRKIWGFFLYCYVDVGLQSRAKNLYYDNLIAKCNVSF